MQADDNGGEPDVSTRRYVYFFYYPLLFVMVALLSTGRCYHSNLR